MENWSSLEENGDKKMTVSEYQNDFCDSKKEGKGGDEGYNAGGEGEKVEEDDRGADAGASLEGRQ